MDLDGNPMRRTVWKGQIKKDQRQKIESLTGRIRFSYTKATESRTRGANYKACINNNVIPIK